MFPTVITGVVSVVKFAKVGINALRLSGAVLGRIFIGELTWWDAAEFGAPTPGLKLPSRSIHVIARSDGSGTTHHLSD